ncbi:MAG: TylF/MycF/NovP-related O-methyltransferase [Chitinophagales bacterium]
MAISRFIFHNIAKALSKKKIYLVKSLSFKGRPLTLPLNYDYVRYATLELCYEEIISAGITGNVAELGVYRGSFASRLNQLFSQKKLYLFDTFKGFNDEDVAIERKKKYSSGDQDFSNTSIELVKSKMPHPENCIFKPGHFPQTAEDVDDNFCFVSIDADLFEPIYQGLKFFYPKLNKGGYIFIHDFNNAAYTGSRNAVSLFCKENDIRFVPIPDSGGTVIITK